MHDLLRSAADRASRYLAQLGDRSVAPSADAVERAAGLGGPLPDGPTDPAEVLELLDQLGSPATVATAGPRYFGFVIGGVLPASLAASSLANAWDQNAGLVVASPLAAAIEEIALDWMCDLLGLPAGAGGALVTCATTANLCGIAAGRHRVLEGRRDEGQE